LLSASKNPMNPIMPNATAEIAALYAQAFQDFGTHGQMEGRRLAEQIEAACTP
jgi:hypothetical protein